MVDAEDGAGDKPFFDILLKSAGSQKNKVIEAVKDFCGYGLEETKQLIECVPVTIKQDLSKEDAMKLKKSIEDAGGEVELK